MLAGCGGARSGAGRAGASRTGGAAGTAVPPVEAAPPPGPGFGLTEDNAGLLWSPAPAAAPAAGSTTAATALTPTAAAPANAAALAGDPASAAVGATAAAGGEPTAFVAARERLTALRPTYIRLLVDWAALQPDPNRPPALDAAVSGCARTVGPCVPYAGLRDELRAIASQQRAARARGEDDFRVVLDVFGVPGWAAHDPSGCEAGGAPAFARAIGPRGLAGYRALIESVLALGASEGVALDWWSPWNEPNDARFLSPQHASCEAGSPTVAPAVYARLARTMGSVLRAAGGGRTMLLGELSAVATDSPHRTSIPSFVAALPQDVLCSSTVWSIHAYATYGAGARAGDPVAALEQALDARGDCGRRASVWVTEAGAGAEHPGRARTAGAGDERAGCLALAAQLLGWEHDPRVGAVFQYSFREDPAFPVGLLSADLAHVYPAYGLWSRYTQNRARGELPASGAALCA